MLFSTVGQARLFVWMMAAGAAVGAWYVLTALLRRVLQAGLWLTLACDLLFGMGSAVILIAALVVGNYGQARPFEILGALCGALLFALGLAPPLNALKRRICRVLHKIMSAIARNRLIKVIFK